MRTRSMMLWRGNLFFYAVEHGAEFSDVESSTVPLKKPGRAVAAALSRADSSVRNPLSSCVSGDDSFGTARAFRSIDEPENRHFGAGQRIQPVSVEGGAQRARGRDYRSGASEPTSLIDANAL